MFWLVNQKQMNRLYQYDLHKGNRTPNAKVSRWTIPEDTVHCMQSHVTNQSPILFMKYFQRK